MTAEAAKLSPPVVEAQGTLSQYGLLLATIALIVIVALPHQTGLPVAGQIPYSDVFRTALQTGQTVMELDDTDGHVALQRLWQSLAARLELPLEKNWSQKLQDTLNPFR